MSILDPKPLTVAAGNATYEKKGELLLSVKSFGAKGDGTTDDTAAFNAAIAYANAQNPGVVDANNVIGTCIFIPAGRYKITGPVTPIAKSGCDIRGAGENATVLLLSNNGPTFSFGSATSDMVVGGGMSGLKVEYLATPGPDASVINVQYASRLRFSNLLLVNTGNLANLGMSAARFASVIDFIDIRGYIANIGKSLVRANFGAGVYFTNCRLFVGGVGAPAANRTSTMDTLAGTHVIELGAGGWDTVHITGCFFERFYHGLHAVAGAGVVLNNFFITSTYFDYHAEQCIFLNATSGASGGVFGVNISNVWLASWDDSACQMSGPGQVRGVSISNARIASAGAHGINIGAGARDISVSDTQISGANRTDVNASGIVVLGGSHITIKNVVAGYDSSWSGFAWQPYNGLYVVADVDNLVVQGCDMDGTAGGYTFEANAAGSKHRSVLGNIGANYAGNHAISVPASGATVTNKTAHTWDLYVGGGTVTAIVKNGVTLGGMTGGQLKVGPGETFALTYSAAPSLTVFYQA